MQDVTSRAWIEIDLGALQQNAETMARRAGVPLIPMVKSDAYGLGAVEVSRRLERLDPWAFGVATTAEGIELRRAGIERRILIFTPLLADEFAAARAANLTPTLGEPAAIAAWVESGGGAWHLAIDTGMNRAGLTWQRVCEVSDLVRAHPPEGAFTHFHSAERNDGSMSEQERRFTEALAALPDRPRWLHADNSAALEQRSPSPWDLARPGLFLYGGASADNAAVRPVSVARLRAPIVEIREVAAGESVSYGATYRATAARTIATVAAGYGDGVRRSLGNRGHALVGDRRVPIVGVVTMDMTMLDVTGVRCAVGDQATLLGRDREEVLDVNDVARAAEASPYELLVHLRLRASRVYVG